MENKIRTVDFIPLAFFAWGPHLLRLTDSNEPWEYAFYLGATAALLQMLYSWYRGHSFDYIALGANAFLIYGALAFTINPALLLPYYWFKQSIVFVWVLLTGIITTLLTPEGFIQGPPTHKQQNLLGSFALLGLTALALIVSYTILKLTDAETAVGAFLPFVGLLASRAVLKNYLAQSVKAS